MKGLNFWMYIVIIAFTLWILSVEDRDWRCSDPSPLKECTGEGMPIRGSKPSDEDDCNTLLNKVDLASETEKRSIKWRRSFVTSIIIATLLFALVINPGKLPIWTTFYLAVIVIFVIIYTQLNWYTFHRFNISEEYIKESTSLIREKCL